MTKQVHRPRVVSVIGTRPEAVKMAPVLLELARCRDRIESILVSTAQHREVLDQLLSVFGIVPDVDLNIMRARTRPCLTSPSLGKPVLVLRKVTGRPEAAEAGLAKVVGTDTQTIIAETSALLSDADLYAHMAQRENPYGDGKAARRIVDAIRSYFAGITDR